MRLNFDYESLTEKLVGVSDVVDDKLLSEDLRNILFRVTGEKVELLGVNRFITYSVTMEPDKVTVSENESTEPVLFQLKSKELLDFLGSYKALRQTRVEEVILTVRENNTTFCEIIELNEETGARFKSSWTFNNVKIMPNMLPAINQSKPEGELSYVETLNIMFYTKNLFSLLQSGTNMFSQLSFAEDYVIVFNASHMTFMKNMLPEAFHGVKFSYRAVSFMDKVLCNDANVGVLKTDTDLYFEMENSYAFIKYDNRLPEYKVYLGMFKRDSAISLDRIYFKDILKRVSLSKDSVEITIDDTQNLIHLKTSKFEQDVPLMKIKGMEAIEKKKFKIMPEVLSKAILGSDEEFSSELFIYYSMQPNKNAVLQFSDDSGTWFSSISIKPY